VIYRIAHASKAPNTRFFGWREGSGLKQRGSIPRGSLTPGPSPYESTHMERGERGFQAGFEGFGGFRAS
jgi:hypothetical protein